MKKVTPMVLVIAAVLGLFLFLIGASASKVGRYATSQTKGSALVITDTSTGQVCLLFGAAEESSCSGTFDAMLKEGAK